MLTAFAMESKTATLPMLDEVAADMRLQWPEEPSFRTGRSDGQPEFRLSLPGD